MALGHAAAPASAFTDTVSATPTLLSVLRNAFDYETVGAIADPFLSNATASAGGETSVDARQASVELFFYGFCLILIPTATIFGNLLVIVSVLRFKILHSAINFFILGLAVADLFVALFVMPYAVYVYIEGGYWYLGELMCDIYSASDVACSTASILLLAVISFDRYRAVSQPIKYSRQSHNIKRVVCILLAIWFFSLALASPIVLGVNNRPPDASPLECRFYNPLFSIVSSVGSFVIPCFFILFIYTRIMLALRKRERAARVRRLANGMKEKDKSVAKDATDGKLNGDATTRVINSSEAGEMVATPAVNMMLMALPSMSQRMRRFERHRAAIDHAGGGFYDGLNCCDGRPVGGPPFFGVLAPSTAVHRSVGQRPIGVASAPVSPSGDRLHGLSSLVKGVADHKSYLYEDNEDNEDLDDFFDEEDEFETDEDEDQSAGRPLANIHSMMQTMADASNYRSLLSLNGTARRRSSQRRKRANASIASSTTGAPCHEGTADYFVLRLPLLTKKRQSATAQLIGSAFSTMLAGMNGIPRGSNGSSDMKAGYGQEDAEQDGKKALEDINKKESFLNGSKATPADLTESHRCNIIDGRRLTKKISRESMSQRCSKVAAPNQPIFVVSNIVFWSCPDIRYHCPTNTNTTSNYCVASSHCRHASVGGAAVATSVRRRCVRRALSFPVIPAMHEHDLMLSSSPCSSVDSLSDCTNAVTNDFFSEVATNRMNCRRSSAIDEWPVHRRYRALCAADSLKMKESTRRTDFERLKRSVRKRARRAFAAAGGAGSPKCAGASFSQSSRVRPIVPPEYILPSIFRRFSRQGPLLFRESLTGTYDSQTPLLTRRQPPVAGYNGPVAPLAENDKNFPLVTFKFVTGKSVPSAATTSQPPPPSRGSLRRGSSAPQFSSDCFTKNSIETSTSGIRYSVSSNILSDTSCTQPLLENHSGDPSTKFSNRNADRCPAHQPYTGHSIHHSRLGQYHYYSVHGGAGVTSSRRSVDLITTVTPSQQAKCFGPLDCHQRFFSHSSGRLECGCVAYATLQAPPSTAVVGKTNGSAYGASPTSAARALAVKMVKTVNRKESSLKRKVTKSQRKEKRATKTLGIVVGIFLVCWVPFFTINILNAVCVTIGVRACEVGFAPFFYATWIGYMNSFMNPIIYTIFNTEFRRAFKSLILGRKAVKPTIIASAKLKAIF